MSSSSEVEAPLKAYVHLVHGFGVDEYRKRYLAGNEPDETPYGFHLAEGMGFQLSFSHDHARNEGSLLSRLIGKVAALDVRHAFANRARIREADVVWTMLEGDALAVAWLMAVGIVPRKPIIGNAVWLFNRWDTLSGYRQRVCSMLSHHLSVLTVHSKSCLPVARRVLPKLRTELSYFGISTKTFPLTPPRLLQGEGPIRILSAGNDGTRDWDTLLTAFGNDPRFHLTIVCWWLDRDKAAQYSNLDVPFRPSREEFRRLYDDADVVALSLKENIYSGITVGLEAAALGKPILSSRTGGMTTYFEEEDAVFVPVGDPQAMRDAVLATRPEEWQRRAANAQARFRERDYSTYGMIRRYADLTREILETAK